MALEPDTVAPPELPGPRAMPVLGARGNFLSFVRDAPGHLRRLYDRYGEIAALARGDSAHVFVFSPRYNKVVLGDPALFHNIDAGSSPLKMREDSALGRLYAGLTTMNGDRHRRQRRLMGSALHRHDIERSAADMRALTERQVEGWRTGQEVDLLGELRKLTLAIAVKTLLGLDPDHDGHQAGRLLQAWMDSVFSIPALALPVNVPGLPYHRLMGLSRRLEATIRELIDHRRAGAKGSDVLTRLTRANDEDGRPLADEELVGETAFLFMAGHATTASALTWTLLLLCTHPDVLRQVRDEPDLLDRIVKESLRLLPPVMWWGKVATGPFELGPYALAAGTQVVFSAYVTHRLPWLFPRPDEFRPQRWAGSADPGPYEYLPFSAGPRMCLGAGFAQQEMKIVLETLLRRWGLTLTTRRVDCGGLMVSQPKRGLRAILGSPAAPIRKAVVEGNITAMVEFG
jgi:cytochrome P450